MPLTPGATLGPYTITAELGHGGMGVVYTAQDPRLDRQVAIKVLPPDLTRDETAKQGLGSAIGGLRVSLYRPVLVSGTTCTRFRCWLAASLPTIEVHG